MKLVLNREEVLKRLSESLTGSMQGGNWQCCTADYNLPRELEFVDATTEYLAAQEAERVRREEYILRYEAEVAARKAIVTESVAEQPGNF